MLRFLINEKICPQHCTGMIYLTWFAAFVSNAWSIAFQILQRFQVICEDRTSSLGTNSSSKLTWTFNFDRKKRDSIRLSLHLSFLFSFQFPSRVLANEVSNAVNSGLPSTFARTSASTPSGTWSILPLPVSWIFGSRFFLAFSRSVAYLLTYFNKRCTELSVPIMLYNSKDISY